MNTSAYVREAIVGDPESLTWVIDHFQPLIEAQIRLRLGGRGTDQDVEDLVNETWLVTLGRLRDLEEREGRLVPVLVRFLGSTALNMCNNALRRQIRSARNERDSTAPLRMDEFAEMTRGIVTRAMHNDLARVVRTEIEAMESEKREVLVYRLLEGRTNKEIAGILGITANLVAVRYRRAVSDLRRVLPGDFADEIFAQE